MRNIDLVLNQAKSWIGLNEKDGSHKQIIDVYNNHLPRARGYKVKYSDNWCATFVSACAIKANLTDIIPLECSCGEMIELAKQMNIWNEDGKRSPNVGDIIMYDWDKKDGWPEHVGIVESVSGSTITVIEGNKSDAVGRRTVSVGSTSIRGYVQPKYSGATTIQPSQPTDNENPVNYQVKVNTKSGVNCRTEASVSSAKITAYVNGTVLNVTKESNGWLYVNNTGWVSGEYCIRVSDSSSSSSNESWKGDTRYYLNNSAVGEWQVAMNKGFDTNELEVDNKFGAGSQAFAKTHLLWSGQTHNCPTAIKWLQERLRYYGFTKLEVNGKWSSYLDACIKTFQKNRGLNQDAKVGLETTYWLLEGTIM